MTINDTDRPRVRFSLRWKITLPFMLLALLLGLGATYLVSGYLATSSQERFLRQLTDNGQQAVDAVVRTEAALLSLERLVANTDGVFEAVEAEDAEDLRARILPLVVNSGADLVVVVNADGVSLLTVRQRPGGEEGEYETPLKGEAYYADWEAVQALLGEPGDGDKRAGLETLALGATGRTDVFVTGGPITTTGGRVLGAVLVGRYVDELAADLRTQSGATVSIYDPLGSLLASSNESAAAETQALPEEAMAQLASGSQDQSPVRSLMIGGTPYGEVLTPFVARGGADFLGFLGISLPEVAGSSVGAGPDPTVVVALSALALLLVVIIGLLISNSITRPLVRMADASTAVATGHLDTRLPVKGSDEISVLAGTFNRMVEGLREGLIYHDLLGRAVTPEVREELRRTISEGARAVSVQEERATVLVAGLRGVTGRSGQDAAKVMASLGEYFAALVPLVAHHGGVVYRFDGDLTVALFGLLPKPSPAPVGAMQAAHAAFELIDLVDRINVRREEAGLRALALGVAVATGAIVAGGLGTRDRIQYTVIGEAVDTALELERVLRESSAEGLLLDGAAYRALGGSRSHFDFGRHGRAQVRGRTTPLEMYEVVGRNRRLLEAGGATFFDDPTSPYGRQPSPAAQPAE